MQADSIREVPEAEEIFAPQEETDSASIYWEEAKDYIEELYEQTLAYMREKGEESKEEETKDKNTEPITFNYESVYKEAEYGGSRPHSPSLKM